MVGLFIVVEDGFPIFFKQDRIGKSYIVVQYGRGGWYQSKFFLKP